MPRMPAKASVDTQNRPLCWALHSGRYVEGGIMLSRRAGSDSRPVWLSLGLLKHST